MGSTATSICFKKGDAFSYAEVKAELDKLGEFGKDQVQNVVDILNNVSLYENIEEGFRDINDEYVAELEVNYGESDNIQILIISWDSLNGFEKELITEFDFESRYGEEYCIVENEMDDLPY